VTGSATRVDRELLLATAFCGAEVMVRYEERADAAADTAEAAAFVLYRRRCGYISGDDVSADGGRLPELSAQPSRGDPDGSRSNSPGTEDL